MTENEYNIKMKRLNTSKIESAIKKEVDSKISIKLYYDGGDQIEISSYHEDYDDYEGIYYIDVPYETVKGYSESDIEKALKFSILFFAGVITHSEFRNKLIYETKGSWQTFDDILEYDFEYLHDIPGLTDYDRKEIIKSVYLMNLITYGEIHNYYSFDFMSKEQKVIVREIFNR